MKKFLPKTLNNPQGFTLVELLVVVSIIAILSVIGVTIFTGVQKNARDAKRRSDIQAISKALEAHYNDTNCGATPATPYCAVITANAAVLFSNGVIPTNPSPGGASYSVPVSPANAYTVCATLEGTTTGGASPAPSAASPAPSASPAAGGASQYCLSNQQ